MDGVGARALGSGQDGGGVQVRIARRRGADAHGLVGQVGVQRVAIGRGVHGDRLDAHGAACADDAHGYLAAVGYEDLVEHGARLALRVRAGGDAEQRLIVLDLRAVCGQHLGDDARRGGGDLVHHLHGLQQADGLALGKGVVVAETVEQAVEAAHEMLLDNKFGDSGARVVIEEFLDGEEFSLFAFVNGDKFYIMPTAQDHKRAYDGDKGPNTGGMGAYAPVPHLPQSVVDTAVDTIVKPVLEGMIKEGRPYTGVLYAGLILTADGPKVIEFNSRFGDPETQIILPRLTSDFAQNITDILDGQEPAITWTDKGVTLGVVVASNGYPLAYEKGVKLPAKTEGDIITYYAGAKFAENGQDLLSNGGRVYMLVTTADTVKDGQNIIYNELNKQNTEGLFYRTDIGSKANK